MKNKKIKKKIHILALDQGTTSTRAILFDKYGNRLFTAQRSFEQIFPQNGWVEHNPEDIWKTSIKVCKDAVSRSKKLRGNLVAMGITNQRETTILWDKNSGKPIYNAIVWQDRRTFNYCKKLENHNHQARIRKKTGLILDPYFSATKIKWILDNVKNARGKALSGQILFGTVDTFLLWRLTKGASHATDATNASRTMLYNIKKNQWDNDLLKLFKIPNKILPNVKDSSDFFGKTDSSILGVRIPITGVAGDQQAAAVGQCCFQEGSIKSTYGTGCFVLINTGKKIVFSKKGLLTTICYRLHGKTIYALEGSIFIAGAVVQWLRDGISLIKNAAESETYAKSITSNRGVYLVPAFTGLGAPYWKPSARGILTGITRDTGKAEIVRAALESVAYQTNDLLVSVKGGKIKPRVLKIDGGMVRNNWLAQFLSDILKLNIDRSKIEETTALGISFLAGLGVGVYRNLDDVTKIWKRDKRFTPKMKNSIRKKSIAGWKKAIERTLC